MESKDAVSKKLKKWMFLYFFSLLVAVGYFILYSGYSLLVFEPERKSVVLNQINAVYSGEDLAETNVSEGELKQFIVKVIDESFTYDYLSFSYDELYEELLSGNLETDLPDHRDYIKNYFSEKAHDSFVDSLKEAPWMTSFYRERRHVSASILSPPVKGSYSGWEKGTDGRLNMSYSGYFFVLSKSNNNRPLRYRVDYNIVAERKPNPVMEVVDTYYFFPLVPMNTFEWQIKTIEWNAERAL